MKHTSKLHTMLKIVPCFILLIFLLSCSSNNLIIKSKFGEISVNVEIADTNEDRENGLMFRENLCYNCGMFFIFDNSDYRSFWMKNTLIPLDMIFIDENFEIVDIKQAVPCVVETCDVYASSHSAQYVLEVNGGFTTENNINLGDAVLLT